jgi:hypothetical protein
VLVLVLVLGPVLGLGLGLGLGLRHRAGRTGTGQNPGRRKGLVGLSGWVAGRASLPRNPNWRGGVSWQFLLDARCFVPSS